MIDICSVKSAIRLPVGVRCHTGISAEYGNEITLITESQKPGDLRNTLIR
jgi:hypothetical protein